MRYVLTMAEWLELKKEYFAEMDKIIHEIIVNKMLATYGSEENYRSSIIRKVMSDIQKNSIISAYGSEENYRDFVRNIVVGVSKKHGKSQDNKPRAFRSHIDFGRGIAES